MPGRFTKGGAFRFIARPWGMDLGRALDEALDSLRAGMSTLQGTAGTPSDIVIDGTADAGAGPQPAMWDHVHNIPAEAPANPTGKTASEGSSTAVMRADATVAQGIVSAKGDILTHDGSTAERLPVGADDTVMMAASGQTTGLIWNTVAALVGKILTTKGDLLTRDGSSAVRKGVGSDYAVLQALATEGDGMRWTNTVPGWRKFIVLHSALQAAAMANDIELFSLPSGGNIHAVKIKHSVAFAGLGITDYKLSVGIAGNLTKYLPAFDVDTAVTDTNLATQDTLGCESHGGGTSIRVAATSTGANLDQSTNGQVSIWVLVSVAT